MACKKLLLSVVLKAKKVNLPKMQGKTPTRSSFTSYEPNVLDMVLGKVQTVYLGQ